MKLCCFFLVLMLFFTINSDFHWKIFTVKFLKIAAPIIPPQFVEVVNLSFKDGIFPDLMKLAKLIPVFKNGSKWI